MDLYNSLPYLAGFILQGEPGLFTWLIHFLNNPEAWKWICLTAVIISNVSFSICFFAGYYSEKFLNLRTKIEKISSNFEKPMFTLPKPLIIIFMRFLLLVRNPIAIYLGIKKYEPWKFIIYNFAGSILWIAIWFSIFYSVQLGIHKTLQQYTEVLYSLYIGFLAAWIIISFKWKRVKELLLNR